MSLAINDLNVPHRLLLGPGPSAVHPRVLRTMSTALIGYLDPEWLTLMDEEQALLRSVFQTKNNLTFPISGTGSAGMETAFCNFVEPGDTVVIGCNGYFSERMCEMAKLYGANVKRIEKPWGEVFTPEEFETALALTPSSPAARLWRSIRRGVSPSGRPTSPCSGCRPASPRRSAYR